MPRTPATSVQDHTAGRDGPLRMSTVQATRYSVPGRARPSVSPLVPVSLRTFEAGDAAAVQRLFESGRLGGAESAGDTAVDMDDVRGAYLSRPGCHFWVAIDDGPDGSGQVVGTVGVQQVEPGVGEVRRLRVAPHLRRRGIGSKLLDRAVRHCTDAGFVKVTLDTHMAREAAIRLFEKHRFLHQRTRRLAGHESLQFYLDLYG